MGIIIGKFRKKKSTYEVLEKLENEITSIEEFGRNTEVRRRKIIRRFILLAVLIYLLLALALYVFRTHISSNYIYFIPLIAFPIIVYLIKGFLAWYYARKLRKNEQTLVKLKDEKKKILNNVMETETYKVAKKILDKFGNESKKLSEESTPLSLQKFGTTATGFRPSQTNLRQRNIGLTPKFAPTFNPAETPSTSRLSLGPRSSTMLIPSRAVSATAISPTKISLGFNAGTPSTLKPSVQPLTSTLTPSPSLKLPRPILPKDRSILDKMVDYLVGDGPNNCFALICKKCYSHNGMATKEEFEYLSFRCPYCSHFNPAPKKRLSRPNIETSSPKTVATDHSSDSDVSNLDSELDYKGPTITELRPDSPDTEKNSDFDKLSDLDVKEDEKTTSSKNAEEMNLKQSDSETSEQVTVVEQLETCSQTKDSVVEQQDVSLMEVDHENLEHEEKVEEQREGDVKQD